MYSRLCCLVSALPQTKIFFRRVLFLAIRVFTAFFSYFFLDEKVSKKSRLTVKWLKSRRTLPEVPELVPILIIGY